MLTAGSRSLGGFGGVADTLNLYNHYVGDPGYLPKDLDEHRAVTPATRQGVREQYLQPRRACRRPRRAGEPELAPARADAAAAEGRSRAPAPRPSTPTRRGARSRRSPAPHGRRRAADAAVVHAAQRPDRALPRAHGHAGRGGEPRAQDRRRRESRRPAGPRELHGGDARSGHGDAQRAADRRRRRADRRVARRDVVEGRDDRLDRRRSRKNFPATLDLLADVALHPTFRTPRSIASARAGSRNLAQRAGSRTRSATIAAIAALYGSEHPYGYIELGTEAVVERDDARRPRRASGSRTSCRTTPRSSSPARSTEAELKSLVEKAFGAWPKGTPGARARRRRDDDRARRDRRRSAGRAADAAASWRRSVRRDRRRTTPALDVMNPCSAGCSRAASTSTCARSTATPTARARSSSSARRRAVLGQRAGAHGCDRRRRWPRSSRRSSAWRDADDARRTGDGEGLDRALAAERLRDEPGHRGQRSANLYIYDLGLDYYTKLPDAGHRGDRRHGAAAAKKYLVPDRMIVVAVGDRAKIEAGLRKLNLGGVETRRADGSVAAGK